MRAAEMTRVLVALLALAALAVGGSACSSIPAKDSGRSGFLDRKWGRGHPRGGVGDKYDAAEPAEDDTVAVGRELDRATELGLRWPLRNVQVTSAYGMRDGNSHEGIDLRAGLGTPVYAAQAGQVLYSGSRIRGYGKLVVIRHENGISTVYAHNSRLAVIRGQRVKQGQLVAYSGKTGHAIGPHVHFEVRAGTKALNPARVIDSAAVAAAMPVARPKAKPKLKPKLKLKRVMAASKAANRVSLKDDPDLQAISNRQSLKVKRRVADRSR